MTAEVKISPVETRVDEFLGFTDNPVLTVKLVQNSKANNELLNSIDYLLPDCVRLSFKTKDGKMYYQTFYRPQVADRVGQAYEKRR